MIEIIKMILGVFSSKKNIKVQDANASKKANEEKYHADEKKLISHDQLRQSFPNATDENIAYYLKAFNAVLPEYAIDTPLRIAHFLAQIGHESGELKYNKENLNYGAISLLRVFGKYFKTKEHALECERKPQTIANIVYANRMGNTGPDDGWKYRGRGLIQLTGKDNYVACGEAICFDLENNPDLINSDPFVCIRSACWFWDSRDLNALADNDDLKKITKLINGGTNGINHRAELLNYAKKAFMVS